MTIATTEQLSLLDPVNAVERRYRDWIERNPQVLATYERMALQQMSVGKTFSVAKLTELIRHEQRATWKRDDGWKLNNDYRAYIARDLKARHPEMARFLKTRKVVGEDA